MDILQAAAILKAFGGDSLGRSIVRAEQAMSGLAVESCASTLKALKIDDDLICAAAQMKSLAGQINVIIHAVGILSCLPHLLIPGEIVEYASLGAGNTGKKFDLETSHRIAEFKFIRWQGGPESIRQNQLFKDFYLLARDETQKKKFLYVLGTEHPLKFLCGGRALKSVLSRNSKVDAMFLGEFGERYATVGDYYKDHSHLVSITDVSSWLPSLNVSSAPTI